jgi:Uma2 family endonuclease
MTIDELFTLPEDGMERWLIRGELREKQWAPRDRNHARVSARLTQLVWNWLDQLPPPRGELLGGLVSCPISRGPDTFVGIDLVYFSPARVNSNGDGDLVEGPPTLAVEVLSPDDTTEEINEKVQAYLDAGVPLVWIVHPSFRTVTVHTPNEEPELFNVRQELTGDPHLPGLRIRVESIFTR